MAKVISQETFNSTVQENIKEFDMGVEEAKQETIEQFQKQVNKSEKKLESGKFY